MCGAASPPRTVACLRRLLSLASPAPAPLASMARRTTSAVVPDSPFCSSVASLPARGRGGAPAAPPRPRRPCGPMDPLASRQAEPAGASARRRAEPSAPSTPPTSQVGAAALGSLRRLQNPGSTESPRGRGAGMPRAPLLGYRHAGDDSLLGPEATPCGPGDVETASRLQAGDEDVVR